MTWTIVSYIETFPDALTVLCAAALLSATTVLAALIPAARWRDTRTADGSFGIRSSR